MLGGQEVALAAEDEENVIGCIPIQLEDGHGKELLDLVSSLPVSLMAKLAPAESLIDNVGFCFKSEII